MDFMPLICVPLEHYHGKILSSCTYQLLFSIYFSSSYPLKNFQTTSNTPPLPVLLVGLQDDGVHDEWDEVCHVLVHLLLVQLEHEHHDDGQLRQHLQGQHRPGDQVVLEKKKKKKGNNDSSILVYSYQESPTTQSIE